MELGYCHACGTRNGPEATKCGKCGIALINLDRSSNIVQGVRSGAVAGVIIGIVSAILSAIIGMLFSGSLGFGVIILVFVAIVWIVKGIIIGAISGVTNSLCYYQNASGIGAIVGGVSSFLPFVGGNLWVDIALGGALGSLASYIERKYFRKMSWL